MSWLHQVLAISGTMLLAASAADLWGTDGLLMVLGGVFLWLTVAVR